MTRWFKEPKWWGRALGVLAALAWLAALVIAVQCAAKSTWNEADGWWQVVLALLGGPILIYQLAQVSQEMRRTWATSELRLYWGQKDGVTKEVILRIPQAEYRRNRIPIVLLNEGSKVTQWYRVQFRVPGTISRRDQHAANPAVPVELIPGQDPIHWTMPSEALNQKEYAYTFRSEGQYAAYPGDERPFVWIYVHLYADLEYPDECEVRYTTSTDQGRPHEGHLTIHLVRASE